MWGSRFGEATSLRIAPAEGVSREAVEKRLLAELDPAELGYQFMNVRQGALAASAGTTPFNALFLGFSFFIVASAVMLIALLFRLGVEQRASEIGLLAAVGLRWRSVAALLLGESAIVAAAASFVGAIVGVGYAWLMLVGLKTWWLEAIRTPFLQLYATPWSLTLGFASGVIISLLTIMWTLWRMRHISARQLLAGQATDSTYGRATKGSRWLARIGWSLVVLAVIIAFAARTMQGEAQAGAFFGSGGCALVAALLLVNQRLRTAGGGGPIKAGRLALVRLALRNAARNPRRSSLTIGLIACAAFLIVAISAFRLDPSAEGIGKTSGSGGFALVASSSQPIYQDLNSDAGRGDLGFSSKAEQTLAGSTTLGLRVQPGDDASCLNLYQTTQPRAIGVPRAMIERGGFAWAGTLASTPAQQANPWLLLEEPKTASASGVPQNDAAIPIVLDANTAMYSLHKSLGDTWELSDGRSQPMRVQIVGLLKNSIFQGDLLMSEANFLARFPDVNGYRMFLVETPGDAAPQVAAVQSALEDALGDFGFDAERSTARLASFFTVQNTYLSTFQSLGGLGLLLGTFGVAAVQMRSVLERCGELALLRATGFRRRRLATLVMLENAALLVGGLAVGVGAALVAVLPHFLSGAASTPWRSLMMTLLVVLATGLAAGLLVVRSALRAPILATLRGN